MTRDNREDLLSRFFEDRISSSETADLTSVLEEDPEYRKEASGLFKIHIFLKAMGGISETRDAVLHSLEAHAKGKRGKTDMCRAVVSPRTDSAAGDLRVSGRRVGRIRRRRVRWSLWANVAACLAIIVGALAYNHWRSTQFAEVLVAHIKATAPNVRIIRRGKTIIAVVDMDILTGDRIETGPGRSATFTYENEKTEILIDENTVLDVGGVQEDKRLHLEKGVIDASVDLQPSDKPMIVTTPQAKAEVKGTRFKLFAGSLERALGRDAAGRDRDAGLSGGRVAGDEPRGARATRIDVYEGLVRFTCLSDGEWIDVGAGRYAVASAGIDLKELPISGVADIPAADERAVLPGFPGKAADVEYVDGPIIFQDDFEGDLGKWKVLSCSSALDGFEPAGAAERRRVQIRDLKGEPRTRVVAIDARNAGGVMIGIQPKIPAMPAAHVIEYDLRMQTLDARETTTFPGVTKRKSLHSVYFKAKDGWYRRRLEFMPVSGVEGQTVYDVKSYIGESLVSHELIEFSNDPLILSAGAGVILIDNVVIRKLVRVNKLGSEK